MGLSSLVGVGLRPTHYPYLEGRPAIHANFFEAISENFMNSEGRPLEMLLKMRSDYPIALHGVSLSIGSDHGISSEYLKKLKALIEKVDPIIVSDHLCWGQTPGGNTHDLLPVPLNYEAFARILDNVNYVQEYLARPILLENISYYLRFNASKISEPEFLNDLCRKSGCKILLDVNNVFVNSINHGFDANEYLNSIPVDIVGQLHVAGHSQEPGYLFDTHSAATCDDVWKLLRHASERGIRAPLIVEWDQDIPEFQVLDHEAKLAKEILVQRGAHDVQVAT